MKRLFPALFILLLISGCAHFQNNPIGTDFQSKKYYVGDDQITFLKDITAQDSLGKAVHKHEIFDNLFYMIDSAEDFILIDMFLFNTYIGKEAAVHRKITTQLKDKLVQKKKKNPSIEIIFITDPVNNVYYGDSNSQIKEMKEYDIKVIYTDLTKLTDSNTFYSAFWRIFFSWMGNSERGFFPHPFTNKKKVSLRSYLNLANFKANHRKVAVTDFEETYLSLVTSANPHDGSSGHSNVAFLIEGDIAQAFLKSEEAVLDFSAEENFHFQLDEFALSHPNNNIQLEVISEEAIYRTLKNQIDKSTEGDSISIGVFYLSERNIISSLIKAAKRGVKIRMILDPNKDAFGREKNGIPNRQVAEELFDKSKQKIKIRWYNTNGEQFHSKFIFIKRKNGKAFISLGSANWTRRNLRNYNLETNLAVYLNSENKLVEDFSDYYNYIWNNEKLICTVGYEKYREESKLKYLLYLLLEYSGFCTF